ncbi:MAG TPA: TM0106 family RecB-like putative nuclease [Mycobacteriales bacterium]|nr:TM0106 family RecB-like putative nuclease [Mycobacteriales bacterium]
MPPFGGYEAKTCARAIHNKHDQTVPEPAYQVPDDLQLLFDEGNRHEGRVFEAWGALPVSPVNLLRFNDDKAAHIEATLAAMRAATPVILGGRLPDDEVGGRTGKPDVLVAAPTGGYHPGDVKNHKVLKAGAGARVSTLANPSRDSATLIERAVRHHEGDALQLAHYWRMLQACGFEASTAEGAIIGSDPEGQFFLTWYELNAPTYATFSRSNGKTLRSPLDRYDHEHAFRRKVAAVAVRRTGSPDDPEPLVQPLGQKDCEQCAWAPVCVEELPAGDLSRELRGTLSVREYLALRAQGVSTVEDLVGADLEALLASEYADDTTNVHGRAARLLKAHVSAQLARDGDVLRVRPDAGTDLPLHDVEIDLDMECDLDGKVYLWGALVTTGGVSEFRAFADKNPGAEFDIARECSDWITTTYPHAVVYHYSHVEKTQMRRILGRDVTHYAGTAADPDRWVDLLPIARSCLESRSGLGLKVVATEAAGFKWRDEDPGGRNSQLWLEQARAGDDAAWNRIVAYNEDDVRATLAIRRFLRENCAP